MEKKTIKWRPCATCKYNSACGGSSSNPKSKPCKGWAKKESEKKMASYETKLKLLLINKVANETIKSPQIQERFNNIDTNEEKQRFCKNLIEEIAKLVKI